MSYLADNVTGKLCHLVQKKRINFGFFQGRDFEYVYRYLEIIDRVHDQLPFVP